MQKFSFGTKTSSYHDSAKRRRIHAVFGVACVAFVLLAFLRGGVGAAAAVIFKPIAVAKVWYLESAATLPTYLRTQSALIDTIRTLEAELRTHEQDTLTIKALTAENTALGEHLELADHDRIDARVLMRPPVVPYDTLLLDVGTRAGVTEGALVYAQGRFVVGSIVVAFADSSLVRLITSPGMRASVYIFGPDIFTEAEGMGGGVLRVMVPQDVPLRVGDVVMVPRASSGVYGEVSHIEALDSSPYQYGYVHAPITLQSVRLLGVARTPPPHIGYEEALAAVASASSTLYMIDIPDDVLVGTSTATSTIDGEDAGVLTP